VPISSVLTCRIERAAQVVADVAEDRAVQAVVAQAGALTGRLDAIICNAGIMIRKPLGELTLAEWSRVLATNLTSTFLLVRATEALLRQSSGSVVTIASTRAHV
jgi:NAD(P)-dependent dehydrogenase (short-subunit alcohol dehydrogenase family)